MDNDLIACIVEGGAEHAIMEILLSNEKLIFTQKQLLEQEFIKCRNARKFEERYLGKDFKSKITIYRILDSRQENFRLRQVYKGKVEVINVITSPEIEILVIIKENKYSDYLKYKSKLKPSEYCKKILKMQNIKSREFVENYFKDSEELVTIIKKYKSLHKIPKTEKSIADILK